MKNILDVGSKVPRIWLIQLLVLVAGILLLIGCEASSKNLIIDSELPDPEESNVRTADKLHEDEDGTKPIMGKEEIILEYITYLSEATDPAIAKGSMVVNIEQFGMGTESSALPTMSLDEAEAAGFLRSEESQVDRSTARAQLYASVALQQHHLVIDQFGPDAWEHVTYTLEETDHVDGKLGYRIASTGELISESEYHRLLRQYWEDVAEKEGLTFYDIFLADDESAEMMENKRVDIIAKYSDSIPVELTTISDAETYRVNLSFHGKRVSDQKYEDFHFIIHNRKGYWTVFQGLTWTEPYPELPEGD